MGPAQSPAATPDAASGAAADVGDASDARRAAVDVPPNARDAQAPSPADDGPDLDIRVVDGESGARLAVPVQVNVSRTQGGARMLVAAIEPPPRWVPAETSSTVLRARIPAAARSASATFVRVRDRAGGTVAGARVWLDGTAPEEGGLVLRSTSTDDAGEAPLTELPACTGTVTIVPPRGLPSVVPIVVRDGVAETLLVEEPAPATVRVTVVDRRGRPVAFARVTPRFIGRDLERGGGADLDLTPLSDVTGVCVLRGMPPQGLALRARWGGVSARAEERAPGTFVIELPLPAGDGA